MLRKDFSELLDSLTDHELYECAKKHLVARSVRAGCSSWKLDYIYRNCLRRNKRLYDIAVKDSFFTINSIEAYMYGARVVDIKRIDFMTETELREIIGTIGAASAHPKVAADEENKIDLPAFFEISKENLYFCTISGASMRGADIKDGDRVTIDCGTPPKDGEIVVVSLDGDMFIKRYKNQNGEVWLLSENSDYPSFKITPDSNCRIFGVARHLIKKLG